MIGILGGVGRVVGREVAEETLGRIIAGRTTEDLFAREEIARRIGKASFDMLVKKFDDMKNERMMKDAKEKENNMNKKGWTTLRETWAIITEETPRFIQK